TLDSAVFHIVTIFVNGKAIAVLSFLFGLGFAVQVRRAEGRRTAVAPLYGRRMFVLLAIGLTHALLWYGDILAVYALLGFALLLFHHAGDRTLLAWAAVLLAAVPLAFGVYSVLQGPPALRTGQAAYGAAMLAAIRSGDAARIVPANVQMLADTYLSRVGLMVFAQLLGLFLLGLWAGRRRLPERVAVHRAAFRRVAVWGAAVAIPASLVLEVVRTVPGLRAAAAAPWPSLGLTVLRMLAVVPLAAAYVSLVMLLMENVRWRRRLAVFAPVGRMALTNYLAQTVICVLIFYGGGLVGRIGPAGAVGIALVVFTAQLAWSPWWLARFRFGPAEWLWRSLTYGCSQPMRIRAAAARLAGARSPRSVAFAESGG
ncbi:MAG TPA: DUF418 domain-containing protein, partial [Longimicrobium sp.]|nr:DUF418 domain-containing protein [Longimicrobium sp.]